MKLLIITLALVAIASCRNGQSAECPEVDTASIVMPYILLRDSAAEIPAREAAIVYRVPDSIANQLFLARYKLERVKYYLNICLRNPSQDKFLKGWIRRAIE
jgi:hypothetical protein